MNNLERSLNRGRFFVVTIITYITLNLPDIANGQKNTRIKEMNITRISAYPMNMALTKPYTIAFETTTAVENVFLEIELGNGIIGIGAASPSKHVIGESIEDTLSNLQSEALQQFTGRDIREFRQLIFETASMFPKHSATRTAIDIALHDAFGQFLGVPVVDFYGRKHHSLPTSVTIGIMNVEDTIAEATAFKAAGFTILKIKTGLNLEEDMERCIKLREKFGQYFTIRVDANQGYNSRETIEFARKTSMLGLELIEQPMPVGHEAEMQQLPGDIRKIIACDESLKDPISALALVNPPATCGIFNIKLMKCGGLLGAFEIATIAAAAKIDLFWGCFDESIASITAALHAAFACQNTRYIDLDGSLDLAEDLVSGGFILNKGNMSIGNAAGFGYKKI
ncbi:dipeptide epimerase [Flavihumibacter fluvii]|uniref:dipeptide epimerase n=1 Tax=Flavihumibacter fluvii TaxID=2838157 RepID=UPI001BDDCC7E|nr:dipeptide epimerase [Flavihumibacter fluvii]ULQ53763.1 dipeptide epimerase [Flavihumibacter fluvii]